MVFHEELADGGWFKLSLAEQMGNIGSEVSRSLNAYESGKKSRFEKAFERSLELFDLSLADKKYKFAQLREIARAREIVCDYFVGGNEYNSDAEFLRKYFYYFGVLANKNR